MKRASAWGACCILLAAICTSAVAQATVSEHEITVTPPGRVEFTPVVAMYLPVGVLMNGVDRDDLSPARRKQLGAASVGARIGVRINQRFGFDSSILYAPGLVAVTDASSTRDVAGRVLMMGARAVIGTPRESGKWGFHFAPGFGVIHRHGTAWARTRGTTDAAVVIGGGVRLRLPEISGSFRFEIEDYVSRTGFHHPREISNSSFHHDMLWSFGYVIPL